MLKTTKSFTLGVYMSVACLCLFSLTLYQDALILRNPQIEGLGPTEDTAFRCSQLVLVFLAALTSMSIQRRPDVFKDGRPVDRMLTTSAIGRFTFTWAGPLLRLAHKKKALNLEDLPKMDHHTRSKDLSEAWAEDEHPRKLWIELVLVHKLNFIIQWILTLVQAFGNFAPQFVNYHLLKILEQRVPGTLVDREAWIWIVVLTLTTIGASWVEAWLFWISWAQIAIPVRAQLSALIFQKALRRKDIKGVTKTTLEEETPNISEAAVGDVVAEDKPELPQEEEATQGKQVTVNLIGVDAKRVADFCSFNYYFPGSLFKLIISFAFLLSIIGWKALVAGFLAMSVTIPVNIYFSKRYASAQDRLMKVRDVKMGVVTEALQGKVFHNYNAQALMSYRYSTN